MIVGTGVGTGGGVGAHASNVTGFLNMLVAARDAGVKRFVYASSSSVYPSMRYTGRTPSDTLGTMQAEQTIVAGKGSQLPNLSRWGDYSSMSVDPVDDCTFWYTQEYLKANGSFNWNTRITNFKFPGCGGSSG